MLDKLLNDLEVIDQYDIDSGDFIKLKFERVGMVTAKATLIDGKWYPKSVLLCDPAGELWVKRWFMEKDQLHE